MHDNTNYQFPGETNPVNRDEQKVFLDGPHKRTVDWKARGLRITRLRLLSDPGFPMWDVSYCWGYIGEEPVFVSLPFDQLCKKSVKSDILRYARAEGVYAKALGILDDGVISKLS